MEYYVLDDHGTPKPERRCPVSETRVLDLHCDTIDALSMRGSSAFTDILGPIEGDMAHNNLQIAFDRMRQVGPWCQCYAVWVPDDPPSLPGGDPLAFYRHARDYFLAQVADHADQVTQVRDALAIEDALETGKVAAMLTVENGSPVGTDLGVVDEWAADGVKMVTLTWNGRNTIASGHGTTDGLSAFGREVVRTLEDRRIVVDVSHLNDVGFWDLMKVVRRPVAASHSNARKVCGHRRNLTDDQFRAIVDMGGVVGLTYCRGFVSGRYAGRGWEVRSDGEVTFDEMAAHLERFLDLGGEDAVALGSDFDGSRTPGWLDSCGKLAPFHGRIAERFGETVARKLLFENAHAFFVRNETQ